jgi:hypothetical protein
MLSIKKLIYLGIFNKFFIFNGLYNLIKTS